MDSADVNSDRSLRDVCPYKGLNYFDVQDAEMFFGREQLTAELVKNLGHHHFLAIVGDSGSGKSSLVRAGLASALRNGQLIANSLSLPIMSIISPGLHPLESLSFGITLYKKVGIAQHLDIIDNLYRDSQSLGLYVRELFESNLLLLIVDQFEELFTLCNTENERRVFIDNLINAIKPESRLIVVITLDIMFYHHCAEFVNLYQAIQENMIFIRPMQGREELRRVIEEPARLTGWDFENGLVDLMLDELTAQPVALSILSHILMQAWEHRKERTMMFSDYQALGRIKGSILWRAEECYSEHLTNEQQIIARNIFLRLTKLGEEKDTDTRQRMPLSQLILRSQNAKDVEIVIFYLAIHRIVTTSLHDQVVFVDIINEVLIREWDTLRQWLEEARAGLLLQHHLIERVQEWQQLDRSSNELYRGARLEAILEWIAQHPNQITDLEYIFIKSSVAYQAIQEIGDQIREKAATANFAAAIIQLEELITGLQKDFGQEIRIESNTQPN